MSIYRVHCAGRVLFLADELAELARVPGGGCRLEPSLWCELESGHEGRHGVKAQFAGGPAVPDPYTVWMRWPDQDEYGTGRELSVLPACPSVFLAGHTEEEGCGLYRGHPGRHGYEFGPPLATMTPDMRMWLGRLRDDGDLGLGLGLNPDLGLDDDA